LSGFQIAVGCFGSVPSGVNFGPSERRDQASEPEIGQPKIGCVIAR